MFFFQNCLKDIELCFNTDYPLDLKPKIYLRKAECYFETGQKENFEKCLDEIGRFLMITLVDDRGKTRLYQNWMNVIKFFFQTNISKN